MAQDASPAGPATGGQDSAKAVLKRFDRAMERVRQWKPLWEEAHDYALPNRVGFHGEAGENRTRNIFDETAVTGVPRFASRLQTGFFPPDGRAFRLEPGPDFQDEATQETQEQLDKITDLIHDALRQSNFAAELHEAFHDLAIGTGNLTVEPGPLPGQLQFQSVPLSQIALNEGPGDFPDAWYRHRVMRLEEVRHTWPKAEFSEELEQRFNKDPAEKVTVVEATERDYAEQRTEAYTWRVIVKDIPEVIQKGSFKGDGSLPWVTFRWSKAANEIYGRGPLLLALPAIKTTNLVVELILQNAEMAIGGLYAYDDDGIFNPDNVTLEPGTFLPKQRGSEITPVQSGAQFDVGMLVLEDQRRNIRKALFIDEVETTGQTPPSATEVAARQADIARDMGAIAGRLQSEFMVRLIRRIVHIFAQQGLIDIPKVDGREIKVTPKSPLLQAQNQQDVSNWLQFQQAMQGSFGNVAQAMVKQTDAAHWLAEKFGIPARLLRSEDKVAEVINQAAQAAQQNPELNRQRQGDVPIAAANQQSR